MPFTKYEALCELQELNGLVLGDNYLSRKACARFVQSIAEDIKGDLRCLQLKTADLFPFSLTVLPINV